MASLWSGLHDQEVWFEKKKYAVARLVTASEGFEVFELPLRGMYINYGAPCDNDLTNFVDHMKKVQEAELKYPIILHPSGAILDGMHRLAKALLNGEKSIKAVQFTAENMIEPDVIEDKD